MVQNNIIIREIYNFENIDKMGRFKEIIFLPFFNGNILRFLISNSKAEYYNF